MGCEHLRSPTPPPATRQIGNFVRSARAEMGHSSAPRPPTHPRAADLREKRSLTRSSRFAPTVDIRWPTCRRARRASGRH